MSPDPDRIARGWLPVGRHRRPQRSGVIPRGETRRGGLRNARGPLPRLGAEVVSPDGAEVTAMSWGIYPDGLHELLVRMRADYRPPEIVITESGAAFDDVIAGNVVEHPQRVGYLASHPGLAAAAIGSRSYRTLIQAHSLLAARP